ncbi:MAG TPA: 16S rRNA (cytidine(1402)-2'-O)-methyltransferase [Xanthomonadales bacterium]|nr:16S rRNA (cytidine(1402)-2'-O)-methyltransferase [Xanthomonadales bacterium]
MQSKTGGGRLYVVATPLGNLGDLSPRAAQTLASVAVIAAEDTRHSRTLLTHHGIARPLLSLHEHNESERIPVLLDRLRSGQSLALISDAGTPLISDPGFPLVRAVRAAGLAIHPVPGPCAAIAALSVAGLACERFCFEGFLPARPGPRRQCLEALRAEPRTLVFYESGHRIEETLAAMVEVFGAEREGVLARELTKLFETVLVGSLADIAARVAADPDQRRGEFVLLVAGNAAADAARLADGRRLYARLVEELPPSRAARIAADLSGAPRKALYGGE